MAVNSFIEGAIKPLLSVWRRPLALAGILLLTACSHDTSLPPFTASGYADNQGAMRIWRKDSGDEVHLLAAFSPWRHGDTSTSEYRWQGDQLALIELNVYGKPPEHIRARFDAQGDLSFMQREVDGQKQQLSSVALSMVDGLNGVLGDAAGSLAQTAWGIGQSLVEGITGRFGDISSMAVKMGGTLKSVFGALKTPLAAAAKAISTGLSGGLMSMFPAIYAGFAGMISTIGAAVQGMLVAVSAALESTLFGIPAGIVVAAAAVALGVAIASIVSKLGKSRSSSSSGGGGGGGGGGGSGLGIDTPSITDGPNKLTETIDANTAKLTEINKSLAKLVKSANALVLSDNMAVSSRVAASGTAQIAAAASNYREGDTNITQNIYSKAHTAADLQREARWEADRAKAQKR